MHRGARTALVGLCLLVLAGCPAAEPRHDDVTVRMLAQTTIQQPPTPPLVWIGREIGTSIDHDHGWSVVFAALGPHAVEVGDERIELGIGEGTVIPDGAVHLHGGGPALEITLEELAAAGQESRDDIFLQTRVLEGVPLGPSSVRLLAVDLGPDAGTRAQAFPGPVLVMVIAGTVLLESAGGAQVTLDANDHRLVPGDAAVRLVNPDGSRRASTLWIALVDADAEFVAPGPEH